MNRPKARQRDAEPDQKWRYLILDGYVDEPSDLGVPPYLSPKVRALSGGLISGGAEKEQVGYITVDQWRQLRGKGWDISLLRNLEFLIIITGCLVPGKYLRGTPISKREIMEASKGEHETMVTGSAAEKISRSKVTICNGDTGVLGESISSQGRMISRERTSDEWNLHLLEGAFLAEMHPDFPTPLICEIETSRGCPRYVTGGCSFCLEPSRGGMVTRDREDIISEVSRLASFGVNNLRVGGQSDLLAYGSQDIGKFDIVQPDPESIDYLFKNIRESLYSGKGVRERTSRGLRPGIDCGIVHTDNSNPAVISSYPEESRVALDSIVRYTTSGSVLALGLESTDPPVRRMNNLNSTPEQVEEAVKIINSCGSRRGDNGMPDLLPGINFLGDLPGQSPETFQGDLEFLEKLLDRNFLLRRINIRRAVFSGKKKIDQRTRSAFWKFRETVRKKIDPAFLGKLLPPFSPLKGVYVETKSGSSSYGRQIGSYPLMVRIANRAETGVFKDVVVTDISGRSVVGFTYPFRINRASFGDLQSIPGIGKKRAATVFSNLPMDREKLIEISPDSTPALDYINFQK